MKRSGFKPRLVSMDRGDKPMKRGKRMGPGKKTTARRTAMAHAIELHFDRHPDSLGAPCQYCGRTMLHDQAVAHHKTPCSELRKAGVEDLDAPHRLLIIHRWGCHTRIHGGGMGRPKDETAALEFRFVETSPASAANGLVIRGVI